MLPVDLDFSTFLKASSALVLPDGDDEVVHAPRVFGGCDENVEPVVALCQLPFEVCCDCRAEPRKLRWEGGRVGARDGNGGGSRLMITG
mmetsp:Transcript_17925/g.42081  ORF Transcript_17925/g.42081 Transcript_17925/m.42081 type:complete len:89 (-) Transcript_17925:133-399(-)